MTVYSPDDSDLNSDWSKTTWDLPTTPGGFLGFLIRQSEFYDDDIEATYRAFVTRPSAQAMPPELKASIEAYLFGGLPVTMAENTPRQVGDGSAPSSG